MAILTFVPRRILAGLMLACSAGSTPLSAQDAPIAVQVPLLLKVLAFDRTAGAIGAEPTAIAILYQGRNRGSVMARDAVVDALALVRTREGAEVRCVAIDLDAEPDLAAALIRSGVRAVYVTPLRAVEISSVATAAQRASVTTLTGSRRYLEEGLAVAIGLRGDRPRILINLEASRLEGAEFSAQLLGMAEVLR
jgi:hypothetical protein